MRQRPSSAWMLGSAWLGSALLGPSVLALSLLSTGCQRIGPTAIQNGRAVYNEAIVATNSQQMLEMIVRMRYDEPHGLMTVASVTANVRLQGSAGANFGIGPNQSFAGNLVPLSFGAVYEENPTISYVPLDGEKYVRQFLTPLPLDLSLLLFQSMHGEPEVFSLLVRSINGIENPAFLREEGVAVDERIARFATVLGTLVRRDWLEWTERVDERHSYSMWLTGAGDEYERVVGELLELLELEAPADLGAMIELPIVGAVLRPGQQAIRIRTRSLYDLFRIAAASVDVAERDRDSGQAAPMPPRGTVGTSFHIKSSESPPENAMVAIQRHGTWYYVDRADTESKRIFVLLEALMSLRLADAGAGQGGPLLTVPVSR